MSRWEWRAPSWPSTPACHCPASTRGGWRKFQRTETGRICQTKEWSSLMAAQQRYCNGLQFLGVFSKRLNYLFLIGSTSTFKPMMARSRSVWRVPATTNKIFVTRIPAQTRTPWFPTGWPTQHTETVAGPKGTDVLHPLVSSRLQRQLWAPQFGRYGSINFLIHPRSQNF